MALISRRAVVLAKKESSYGSDPTLAEANDALEIISDLIINSANNSIVRGAFDKSLSQRKTLVGSRWVEVNFTVELRGSGTASTAPQGIGALLQACGMSETITTTVTYAPLSTSFPSVAIEVFVDGLKHQVLGCRGSVKLVLIAGETGKLMFTFWGKYTIPTDVAVPSPTYDTTVPPLVISGSYTFDADANISVIQQLEIDLANTVTPRPSLNDATGIAGFEIVSREPKGSMNPEAVLVAGYDIWTAWADSVEKAITITIGSVSGNKYVITAPKATIDTVNYGDRGGIRIFEVPLRFGKSAVTGDDEISIVHST